MPHLTLEYSDNLPGLNLPLTLTALNASLVASGHFEEADVKSRALRFDTFVVGSGSQPRAFVHARLALLSGRSTEVKRTLAEGLLAVLTNHSNAWKPAGEVQISVETQDMDRASYAKAIVAAPA